LKTSSVKPEELTGIVSDLMESSLKAQKKAVKLMKAKT